MVSGRTRDVTRHRSVEELEAAIRRAVRTGDARLVQRLCFVRTCYAGESASGAARRVGVSRTTGSRWLDRWNDGGIDGLCRSSESGGRPPKLDVERRDRLRALVADEGPLTTASLHERLRTEFEVAYAVEYLPRLLRSIGLSATSEAGDNAGPGRPPLVWRVDPTGDDDE